MTNKILVVFIISLTAAVFLTAESPIRIPGGWFSAGSNPAQYEMGIDSKIFQTGHSCAYIKSKMPKEKEFGTLMQTINAENYIGKRLRFSGYIKSENVKGWSGMWMRIDDGNGEQLGFDNMQDRAIKGTTDWKKYKIVLDVPSNSKTLNFGVLLWGEGKVWADNFSIAEVDNSVPVTNLLKEKKLPGKPINMDFEE